MEFGEIQLFLSFTAALFEEGGRVLICSLFLKSKKNWPHAVALGIGHGGFEAMSLVGLTYISNLVMMALINLGLLDAVNDPTGALSQTVVLLTETPSIMFLLAGIERVLAMILHIGFSVLVVYGLSSRNYRYVFYEFSAHFILNPLLLYRCDRWVIHCHYICCCHGVAFPWIIKISPALFWGLQ